MARDFNGSTQLLYATTMVTAYPLTMACWFNSDSVTVQQFLMAVVQYGGLGDYFALEACGIVTGDPVRASVYQPGVAYSPADSTAGYTAGTWYHACGVYTSATARAAFINGANKGTVATNVTPGGLSVVSIGTCYRNDNPAVYTDGRIAEAAIWGAALTDAEVAILALGVSPLLVQPANLLAYWPLVGNNSPEIDLVGGVGLTLSVSPPTKADHPRVRYAS